MQQIAFGDISQHRWRHSEFAGRIADMAIAWGQGEDVTAEQIREFLTDWLVDHILVDDMEIGAAVRGKKATRPS